ncbi:hypothetical protein Tco_0355620 [Tanacetum coccineum]
MYWVLTPPGLSEKGKSSAFEKALFSIITPRRIWKRNCRLVFGTGATTGATLGSGFGLRAEFEQKEVGRLGASVFSRKAIWSLSLGVMINFVTRKRLQKPEDEMKLVLSRVTNFERMSVKFAIWDCRGFLTLGFAGAGAGEKLGSSCLRAMSDNILKFRTSDMKQLGWNVDLVEVTDMSMRVLLCHGTEEMFVMAD